MIKMENAKEYLSEEDPYWSIICDLELNELKCKSWHCSCHRLYYRISLEEIYEKNIENSEEKDVESSTIAVLERIKIFLHCINHEVIEVRHEFENLFEMFYFIARQKEHENVEECIADILIDKDINLWDSIRNKYNHIVSPGRYYYNLFYKILTNDEERKDEIANAFQRVMDHLEKREDDDDDTYY